MKLINKWLNNIGVSKPDGVNVSSEDIIEVRIKDIKLLIKMVFNEALNEVVSHIDEYHYELCGSDDENYKAGNKQAIMKVKQLIKELIERW